MATTRLVVKLRPSLMRSTSYRIGAFGSPGRRKYEWNEWTSLVVVDCSHGGHQGLPCDLSSEDSLPVLVRTHAPEDVHLDRFEHEELDQIVKG